MQDLKWYLADLKSTGKNTIETVEKSLTDMFIRLVRIYPCLSASSTGIVVQVEGGIPPFLKTRPLILSYHGISY